MGLLYFYVLSGTLLLLFNMAVTIKLKWQLIQINVYLDKRNGVRCGVNLVGHTHVAVNKTS